MCPTFHTGICLRALKAHLFFFFFFFFLGGGGGGLSDTVNPPEFGPEVERIDRLCS